jgi:hypothetical protein
MGYSAHVTGQTGFTGNVNFIFTKSGTTHIIIDPAYHTNKLNDITCNHSSLALHLLSAINIKGNLTCTAGSFSTQSSGGGTSHALTVTKAVTVGTAGTLNFNGSTVSIGTLSVGNGASATMTFSSATTTITLNPNSTHPTWGFGLGSAATVNMNGGTIKFAKVDSGTRYLQMGGQGVHVLNDVIVDTNMDIPWASYFESASLDIQDGNLNSYGGSNGITITKELTVGNGTDAASLGYTSDSNGFHDQSFGGITINNNGTLNLSNQNTYVTGGASITANRCLKCSTSGVFALNGGTLNVTGTDWGGSAYAHLWVPDGFDFGNVTINAGGADGKYYQFREGSGTMNFNDVYCKSGEWRDYNNNNTFNIRGNLDIGTRGAGGTNAVFFSSDARDNANTTKLIVGGLVANYTNGQFHVAYGTDGTDGCKIGGLRNVGGTVYGDTA